MSASVSGGPCAGSQNMRYSITSHCQRLEPHRSSLSSDKQSDLEYIHLDRARKHTHTQKHKHTDAHTHILVSQKFMHAQTRIHTHSASSTAFQPLHTTTSPEGVCHHTHTYQEYLLRTTVSHTQSAPCEINIQGGMIFPVGGCLFVCPSPPLRQSVANTQCH